MVTAGGADGDSDRNAGDGVMLNFTVLLPATIFADGGRVDRQDDYIPGEQSDDSGVFISADVWRIDAVAILILSLLLVPIAEEIPAGSAAGGWLIFAYCFIYGDVDRGGGAA